MSLSYFIVLLFLLLSTAVIMSAYELKLFYCSTIK